MPKFTVKEFACRYALRAYATFRSKKETVRYIKISIHTLKRRVAQANAYGWHTGNVTPLNNPRNYRNVLSKYIYESLKYYNWNRAKTANRLAMSTRSLRVHIKILKESGYDVGAPTIEYGRKYKVKDVLQEFINVDNEIGGEPKCLQEKE